MNPVAKLVGLAAMALSSFVAPKIAAALWKGVSGKEPPSEDAGSKFVPLIVFAAMSAVLMTGIELFLNRGANKVIAKRIDKKQS